jgi:hypothetical protein
LIDFSDFLENEERNSELEISDRDQSETEHELYLQINPSETSFVSDSSTLARESPRSAQRCTTELAPHALKNRLKLINPISGEVVEPPARRCQQCGEWMNWRFKGQLLKQKNGRRYYQNCCKGNCQREKINKLINLKVSLPTFLPTFPMTCPTDS